MTRRITVFALFLAVVACATAAQAVPVFFLSTEATGTPTPGPLDLTGVAPNSMGQLHLWTNSDVRLAGVSLDILETGGGIKFTGVNVPNPAGPPPRWAFLDGPQMVTDSSITSIGGAAIPGAIGDGVGMGSSAGATVLLATIDYMALGNGTMSDLSLRVGNNTISDFAGAPPMVKFGGPNAPDVPGGAPGGMGEVGSVMVGEVTGDLPMIMPVNLGEVESTGIIMANLTAANGPILEWTGLTSTAGSPAMAATLTAEGAFSWNPAGSARGPKGNGVAYSWTATARNAAGTDTDVALTLSLIPEPATISLIGLAMVGVLGLFRRRS